MSVWTSVWYAVGIVVTLTCLLLLSKPLEVLLRSVMSAVLGGLALEVLNLAGVLVHGHLAVNPVSAMIVGVLGVPGVALLGLLHLVAS